MREIHRTIVSAIIFSKDGKVLMGRKDPSKGGVYTDCWHIPGGGVDEGETLEQALIREVQEETGITITTDQIQPLTPIGSGTGEKVVKETGEKVLCHMAFHRFEIRILQNADDIILAGDSEFIEMQWFDRDTLIDIKQIPGGKDFFMEMGYI
jgi:8-oxo-dGTP pyrophosphatase MutT (NUDIX family)